jgi:hypothetical protein
VHRRLLVPDEDVADGVLLEQRVVERKNGAARIAEDHLDALVLQRPQDDLGARHHAGIGGLGGGRGHEGFPGQGRIPRGHIERPGRDGGAHLTPMLRRVNARAEYLPRNQGRGFPLIAQDCRNVHQHVALGPAGRAGGVGTKCPGA